MKSSGEAEGEARVEGQGEEDPFADFESTPTDERGADEALPGLEGSGEPALLGARHDVFLRDGVEASRCRCLAVLASHPGDERFYWESQVPSLDARRQMVIAFTSRGQSCSGEPEGSQGAAYRGYEVRGPDVVVMVEASRPGRPLITGAILPRPSSGGRVLIEPFPGDLPYGKPLDDDGARCVVPEGGDVARVADEQPPTSEVPEAGAFDSLEDDSNQPNDDNEDEARRTGFYLGLLAGPGYAQLSADDGQVDSTVSGLGVDFDLMIGGSPTKDFAIGGVMGAVIVPGPELEAAGQTFQLDDVNLNAVRFGAFADYYLVGNLHALLELGYVGVSFSGASVMTTDDSFGGFGVGAGLGYDFWIGQRWSLGLLGRFGYGWLDADQSSADVMLPVLAATLTFH